MKMRDVAMLTVGSLMTLAYQKYNKPVMKAMKDCYKDSMKNMDKMVEDMM